MFPRLLLVSFLTLSLLAACGAADSALGVIPPTSVPSATSTPQIPTPTAYAAASNVLRVWLPTRFNPKTNPLLQARLDAFLAEHAGLKLDIRIKDETNILEALHLTSLAAPAALPDLIALPRTDMESAAALGLLQPLDASLLEGGDWVPAARALGRVRESVFGLPFALDALVLASSEPQAATSWQEIGQAGTLTFDKSDSYFPLALYLAADGALTDADGNPALDEVTLTRVLGMFAHEGVVAADSAEQVRASLGQGGGFAVGWASGFLNGGTAQFQMEALPGLGGPPATLVTSWDLAVAGQDVEHQKLAAALASWLTDGEFLSAWDQSTGYLSPRRATTILDSSRVVPPVEIVEVIAPLLRDAVASVLAGVPPEVAAHTAVARLK